MRITFKELEVEDLIQFLEGNCDACTDWEVAFLGRIVAKLKRAISYSEAGKTKYHHLQMARWRKDNELRRDGMQGYIEAKRKFENEREGERNE